MGYKANRRVETSIKTFEIIERLKQGDPVGVSELASEMDMSKSIVHNHLSTLRELGYITKIEDKYALSLEFFTLGTDVRSKAPLYKFGRQVAEHSSSDLAAPIIIAQKFDNETIVIYRTNGTEIHIPDLELGATAKLGRTLPGVAILRTMDKGDIDDEAVSHDHDHPELTPTTESDEYVIGNVTTTDSVSAVASPVTVQDDVIGSICVLSPQASSSAIVDQIVPEITSIRSQLESQLKYNWSTNQSFATIKHSWYGD
ncbi:helix-turn-helix domain-containing protein [Natrarchaeobius halalkaliphilus]|nr:helix-turn-helix domain-containing protein [Natrarchaeobius halalkaliphilus]